NSSATGIVQAAVGVGEGVRVAVKVGVTIVVGVSKSGVGVSTGINGASFATVAAGVGKVTAASRPKRLLIVPTANPREKATKVADTNNMIQVPVPNGERLGGRDSGKISKSSRSVIII